MSLSRRTRRAAAVGLGSFALVLMGPPAFALDVPAPLADAVQPVQETAVAPSSLLDNSPVPLLTEPLRPVADATAPVVDPIALVVAPSAPADEPAPGPADPVIELVEEVVGQVEDVLGVQILPDAEDPATAPVPTAPTGPAPAAAGPATPVVTSSTAVSRGAEASTVTTPRILGVSFPRGVTGAPARSSQDGSALASAPSTSLPGTVPETAPGESFQPASSGTGGPASLPALLVAVATAAVAITAAAHAAEIRRRRQVAIAF